MTNIEATGFAKADGSRPLLSIIIPTCNRQVYAASAIRCALAIPSSDIEVVVQDCSDEDTLSSLIAAESLDKRLSYRYERPAYMIQNWNRAIGRAIGEYLCLIGDDDEQYSGLSGSKKHGRLSVAWRRATHPRLNAL